MLTTTVIKLLFKKNNHTLETVGKPKHNYFILGLKYL